MDSAGVAREELVAVANQDGELKRNVGVLHYGFRIGNEFLKSSLKLLEDNTANTADPTTSPDPAAQPSAHDPEVAHR